MPMYGTNYIFSKPFFRFWVALTFMWAFGAMLVITLMPLIESRKTIVMFWRFVTGKRDKALTHMEGIPAPSSDEALKEHEETEAVKRENYVRADEEKL
jgi:hypothetical protein